MPSNDILHSSVPSDPDELHLSILHPADGRALRYHADEFAIRWIAELSEAVSQSPQFVEAEDYLDREMLKMHIENVLHSDLLSVCRAYTRRHYLQLIGRPSSKPVVCQYEIFELVRNHWPDDSIQLVTARRKPLAMLRRIVRGWRRIWRELFKTELVLDSASIEHPMVAVELVEGVDPHKKADAFWLADKAVDPRHVLFIFEKGNHTLLDVEKEINSIKQLGANAVALDYSVSANGKIPLWLPPRMPIWLKAYSAAFTKPRSPLDRWLLRVLMDFGDAVWRWESFFRQFNISVYQHFTEHSPDIAARRLAIDRLGGIEVGKMRSQFFDQGSAGFYFQHEVAFVWHDNVKDTLRIGRTRTSEVIGVGYIWEHLFGSMADEAKTLRQRLLQPGTNIILTIYDNWPHINGVLSLLVLERFYSYLVHLVQQHKNLALLVKTKKPQVLEKIPHVKAALRSLENEGRCLMLEAALASVVPAALASDLVVAIPASTAACEAALGKRNVLMYDPGGGLAHPLNGDDKGIIYRDFDLFTSALEKYLSGTQSMTPANASPYINLIDPFCDGGAARRAAGFIAGFLEAKRKKLDKRSALDAAHQRFREACIFTVT